MQEPTTVERLVERIKVERAVLGASFANLPDARLDEPGVAGHWSVKDILVHVAWWERQTVAKLHGAATAHDLLGGADNDAQIDRINDRVYQEHRTVPVSQAKATFDETGMRLSSALTSLSEEAVLPKLEFIAENTYRHYPEHAKQIREWQPLALSR